MISRSIFAAMLLASSALADPPLTTIQDVLYKADGTRFAGTLTISWTSFEAVDTSAIASQVTTVSVTNGNLRVQLVPSTTATPAATYTVKYNSDGRIQFTETWAVPSSIAPLRVRDVRVATSETGALGADTATTPVQESDVAGLVSDLGARPLRGPGYAAGRVAVVNNAGALDGVIGNPSDCVRVDGSSGPCGGSAPSFVDGDTPAGIVDGSNTGFTLSANPAPTSSLAVYRNGMLQTLGQDYNVTGNLLQFVAGAAPQPGDTLLASYRLGGTSTGSSSVSGNFVDPGQSYSNPTWIASLAYTKITGVPSFEPAIQAGSAGQYLRGDKSWQTLNAAAVANAADITSSYNDPAWLTITKAKVGLGTVENTALSTWPGTSNLTTIGTLAAGTVPWARLSGVPAAFAPASHAATHAAAGSDPVTAAAIGAVPNSAKNQPNGYVGLDASGNATIGTTVVGASTGISAPNFTGSIVVTLAGTAGQTACGYLGYAGTITGATIAETSVPPVSSSAVVDLWIGSYQPTVSNTIVGSGAKPTLAGATIASPNIAGWSTSFVAGQWICGHLDSVTSAKIVQLILSVKRN